MDRFSRLKGGPWPLSRRSAFAWLWLIVFLWLPFGAALADDPWAPFDLPWFDRLGVSDGLPHSIVTAIEQDQRGLIWFGTQGGLVRYDGYRMITFGNSGGSTPDLADAYVRTLLALPDGGMLIGTNAGGLSRFDPQDNRFRTYSIGKDGTSDRKIYALAHDGNNGVWIATDHGLDHLDLSSDRITHVAHGGGELAARNFTVTQDRAGDVWLGNDHGLFVRTPGSNAFVRPPHPQGTIDTVLKDGIWAIYEDDEGRLWAGSTQSGAVYRDAHGTWHDVSGFSGFQQSGERRSTVRDFLEVAPGTVWIATDGNGVMGYAPESGRLWQIAHDSTLQSSLPGDSIRALKQDRAGNVWVASDLGVARTRPNARVAFSLLPAAADSDHGLANTNVRGIYVDTKGRIWLGMNAGRVDVIDLQGGRIHHLQLGGDQTHRDVQAFAEMPDGSIWVGTQGIARISPDTLAVQDSIVPTLDDKPILHLLADGQQLLIGTYDGVYRYNPTTKTLAHFAHSNSDNQSLTSDTVRGIDRIADTIWYLTVRGISVAHDGAQAEHFTNLLHHADDPTSLPNNFVTSVAADPQGRLWVGTYGGLGVLESPSPQNPFRFQTIDVSHGLGSNNINAVEADEAGNIWVSLPNGLAKIDGKTHSARNLSSRDGARISSYIYAASAKAPTGELLFGGLGGVTIVRPQWQAPPRADPSLSVTYASRGGQTVPFGQLPLADGSLALQSRNRSLRLDYALLDYQSPQETTYSYRLDGFDDDWIDVPHGGLPSAIYTNLPNGEYVLHLRAQTQGLSPRTYETSLHVDAAPRWYETAIAKIGAALATLAILLGVVQLRTLYLRQRAEHLQRQVDMRTRDLIDANRRLDELASTDELTGAFNRRRVLELAETIRRNAKPGDACMALLDLDHFKRVNDTYGHLAGDEVIRAACRNIQAHCREGDLVGRYGGEELLVCLPHSTLQQGMVIAERICAALAGQPIVHNDVKIAVTASIGVAAFQDGETLSQWLMRADTALYEAKREGRNRCAASA